MCMPVRREHSFAQFRTATKTQQKLLDQSTGRGASPVSSSAEDKAPLPEEGTSPSVEDTEVPLLVNQEGVASETETYTGKGMEML